MRAQGVYSASKLAAFAQVQRLPNAGAVLPCIIAARGGGLFHTLQARSRASASRHSRPRRAPGSHGPRRGRGELLVRVSSAAPRHFQRREPGAAYRSQNGWT